MRRAALIFNTHAGRGGRSRHAALVSAVTALRSNNIEAEIVSTHARGTAGKQALAAANNGAELIFACGGDGTLHEVIQGIAFHPSAMVGILPLGSANALARHLGLSFDPTEAIRQQLQFRARLIPLGRVTCETRSGPRSRYFAVMTGAGPDGMLVYRMLAAGKQRLGRSMYYLRAARLFLSSSFPTFTVTRTHRWNPYTRHLRVAAFTCSASQERVHVQADGEWIGYTPMQVELVPDALRLLMPA